MHVRRLILAALVCAGCGGAKAPSTTLTCTPPECAADTSLTLVAEVEPTADSPLVRQEFGSIDIDPQSGQFVLALDPVVTLSGQVRIGSGTNAERVAATVVATRPSRIPGRPDVFYQTQVDPTTGQYTLAVSRNRDGEQYVVRVTATDLSLVPPMQKTVAATADQTLDLTFADPLTLPEIHGVVLDSLQTPVPDMQVQAIDPATNRMISTTATTDAQGAYAIRLPSPPPAMVTVVATPTSMAAAALPSLALPVATDHVGTANAITANLQVPPLPAPAHVIYKVTGTSSSGADTAVAGATCTFSADVSDPNATDGLVATFAATAMTDSSGNAAVDLIPLASGSAYAVTVSPDASSTFGATSTTVTVGPQGGYSQSIILTLRPVVSGRVFDPKGMPLRGLMVVPTQSTVAAALGPTPLAAVSIPPQTVTDGDGRFSLRLDAGVWDIGLIPPPATLLPRLWLANTTVEDNVDLGEKTLPLGAMVHGLVDDASGMAVPKATVRLYTVAPGNSGCAPTDTGCLAPPRLRAEGSTGVDGTVGLILPSQPD